jgi:phosphoribosylanthranilate isomerase
MRAARIPVDPATPFDLLKFAAEFSQAQALLLDAHVEGYGGAGTSFPWSRLPTSASFHAVLSGGLTPANVGDGITQVRPRFATLAVDVSSGVEASKGIKDAGKIHQFVAAVRAADERLARSPHVRLPAT